jgi:hypothetical protein
MDKKTKIKKRKPLALEGLNIETLLLPYIKEEFFDTKRVFRKRFLFISR